MAIRKFVLLVAGHGGGDPGAVGQGSTEAQETIQIVDRLYNLLLKHPNIVVERVPHELDYVDSVTWANQYYKNIDDGIVIEVHKNASAAEAHGNEVLIPAGSDATSRNFAGKIQAEITHQTGLANRGVKERNDLYLIREINMYACLVECGFMGYDPINDDWDAKWARGIADGICDFFGEARVSTDVVVPPIVQPPAPDTTDMLYRLMIDDKQKAAYKEERNAYNGFVKYMATYPEADIQVMFKDKDVTVELFTKYAPAPVPVVTTKEELLQVAIKYTTRTVYSDMLDEGTREVTQEGREGLQDVIYVVTYTDGKETNRVVKSTNIKREMVEAIVTVGTKKPEGPTDYDKKQDGAIEKITSVLAVISKAIADFLASFKKG